MSGKTRNYFAHGNTARGFYSLFESNIEGLNRLYILKGGPGTGKSTLIKRIGVELLEKNLQIEIINSPMSNNCIDGIIIPSLKLGIIDGDDAYELKPKAPGVIEEYVSLDVALNSEFLCLKKDEILERGMKKREMMEEAYKFFGKALKIHDEWERIYIENLNCSVANEVTCELKNRILGDKLLNKKSTVRDRFLGAATPQGSIDFINNLTNDVEKRYFIKGRPGTGKSTLLRKIASSSQERGFDVEIYHCGFDPYSLDMVIMRELGVAIFDSTSPHEYFPERKTDEIIDMYEYTITPGTDEKYATELNDIISRYKDNICEGTDYLLKAQELNNQIKDIYTSSMNFKYVDDVYDRISTKIAELCG